MPTAGSANSAATASTTTLPAGGSSPPAAFRTAGSVSDLRGDAGLLVPGYADLILITIEDNGSTARLTVETSAPIPARLPATEVAGVGIDLYEPAQTESGYQLFVDGSADGWFAYLYAGGRLIRYPGTVALGGSRLVLEVPWTAIGGAAVTGFSVFYDWSQDGIPDNRVGEDRAPVRGTAAIRR